MGGRRGGASAGARRTLFEVAIAAVLLSLASVAVEAMAVARLEAPVAPAPTRVYARPAVAAPDGTSDAVLLGVIAAPGARDARPVALSDVPPLLVDAVLALEDRRFMEHHGIDLRRIAGAALADLKAGSIVQGGSTITQQLARSRWLHRRRTLGRKLREAAMAVVLEHRYSKPEILEAYLNEVYLGQEGALPVHGVARAAQIHFGRELGDLRPGEIALLAGLIRAPNLYDPSRHPETARARRAFVVALLRERKLLSDREADRALREPLPRPASASGPGIEPRWFLDFLRPRLDSLAGGDAGSAGMTIVTTLDPDLQRAAEHAVVRGLARLEEGASGSRSSGGDRPLEAALVAMDPRTGEILAMVGGRDYAASQFNRATRARRQPGSAFKPVVALAALRRQRDGGPDPDPQVRPASARGAERGAGGFTLATLLDDAPLEISTPAGPWRPANYDDRFRGPVPLREALERSLNVPFARLGMAVGPERVADMARSMGIESPLRPWPSIALGAFEVTPLELVRAYATLAAGGRRPVVRGIVSASDRYGRPLARDAGAGTVVASDAEAFLVTSALRGAVERGTGRSLRAFGFRGPVAAKTGTTDGFRDGWFVAYTPSLVVGVWVGHDDGRSVGRSGSQVALPIVAGFLEGATGADGRRGPRGVRAFAVPDGLELAEIDPLTGLLAGPGCPGRSELFLAGTAPRRSCSPWGSYTWPVPVRSSGDGTSWDAWDGRGGRVAPGALRAGDRTGSRTGRTEREWLARLLREPAVRRLLREGPGGEERLRALLEDLIRRD